jgi:hypothetical protein
LLGEARAGGFFSSFFKKGRGDVELAEEKEEKSARHLGS